MTAHSRARWLGLIGAVLTVLSPSVAQALTFSAPVHISGQPLNGVACPGSRLCIAVDNRGATFTSVDPAAGGWFSTAIDGDNRLLGISCASTSFCAATDSRSRVLISTSGFSVGGHWHATSIDRGHKITGISCPARGLCVAVDRHGGIVSSTRPTAGASAWHRIQAVHRTLAAISCATTKLCVAIEPPLRVLVSTHPTHGRRAWHSLTVVGRTFDFESFLQTVSCPGLHLCVASVTSVGDDTFAWVATHPTSKRSWHEAAMVDSQIHDGDMGSHAACGSPTLCEIVDGSIQFGGLHISESTDPTLAWNTDDYPGSDSYDGHANGVACARAGPCVIVTRGGDVLTGS